MSNEGEAGPDDHNEWTARVAELLGSLDRAHVPSLEYLLLDGVATWLFSDANPGSGYDERIASEIISLLFTAMSRAPDLDLVAGPDDDGSIAASRDAVVTGAHQLSEAAGARVLIARAMPTMIGELEAHAGDPGPQLQSAYFYLLLAVATGSGGLSEAVAHGIGESFAAWDGLFASGAVTRLS